jgi:hypothetical protein
MAVFWLSRERPRQGVSKHTVYASKQKYDDAEAPRFFLVLLAPDADDVCENANRFLPNRAGLR